MSFEHILLAILIFGAGVAAGVLVAPRLMKAPTASPIAPRIDPDQVASAVALKVITIRDDVAKAVDAIIPRLSSDVALWKQKAEDAQAAQVTQAAAHRQALQSITAAVSQATVAPVIVQPAPPPAPAPIPLAEPGISEG